MTTQPDLPDSAAVPTPPLRLAPLPQAGTSDVDFDSFVRRYETRLRRLVVRRIGDPSEAEEITQETLLRAYQHRASFGTEDELMAWSTVVAQRLVIDRVRVRGRSIAVPEVPETARLGRDTADIVVARHEARAALEALEAIPTRQAAILWAREVEGLHYDDIAERFGITEPAVRSLLHRGRRALRREFRDRTGTVPLNGLVPFAPYLLALKAAGKVRQAAKSVTNPLTAAALTVAFITTIAATTPSPVSAPASTYALPRTTSLMPNDVMDMPPRTGTGSAVAAPGASGDSAGEGTIVSRPSGGEHLWVPSVPTPASKKFTACVATHCAVPNASAKAPTLWVDALPPETGYQYVRVVAAPWVQSCDDVPNAPRVHCTEESDEYPEEQPEDDSHGTTSMNSLGGNR